MAVRECVECGHPMRTCKESATKRPGTRVHSGFGMCRNCYMRAKRGGQLPENTRVRPHACTECGRQTRPETATEEQRPGTTLYGGKGLCKRCYNLKRRRDAGVPPRRPGVPRTRSATPRTVRPAECVDCGVPLRSNSANEADHPGTRPHAAKGMCHRCYGLKWRRQHNPTAAPAPVEKPTPIADPALEAFNRKRRERLARQNRRRAA